MKITKEVTDMLFDFKKFCKAFLKIKTKEGNIVPFVLNPVQEIFAELILTRLKKKQPIRFIILKARQLGISTLIIAFIFWFSYTHKNQRALILGHIADASTNLFRMYKRFYDNLPDQLKPEIKTSTAKELIFSKIGSEAKVETAEGREGVGRSDAVQIIHATECAFYADAEAVLTAVLQTLSDKGFYFEESTANGIGGRFYNDWENAKAGKSDLVPVFFAWFENPLYTLPFESEEEKKNFVPDKDELLLVEQYKLSPEQLNWRRYTIAFKCGGSVDTFHQEYPSNDKEAFLTSGRPVFDINVCSANYTIYRDYKPQRFILEVVKYDHWNNPLEVRRVEDKFGQWFCYEEIELNDLEEYRFAAGLDPAEGLEQGDYSSVEILDRKTLRYPYKFHGHLDNDLMSIELFKMHLYLKKKCFFCIERNSNGLATILISNKMHLPLYTQEVFRKGFEVSSDMLGYRTDTLTRKRLVGDLKKAIREQSFVDKDAGFWSEAMTFVTNAQGKDQAQGKDKDPGVKCFDDRVFAKALSIVCHNWLPAYFVGNVLQEEDYHDYGDYSNYN